MSQNSPPDLFDRALRRQRRNRAAARFAQAAFLHDAVIDAFADRLSMINRQFADVAILAAADGRYARALRTPPRSLVQIEQAQALAACAKEGEIRIGDPAAPALAPQSCDLILFGLDLHAINDPVGALIQARHALRPDGLLLAALPAGNSLTELRQSLSIAESEIEGGLSPRIAPMADLRSLGALLQRAGYALPVADAETLTVWYRSPIALMKDLQAMGESNCLTQRRRRFLRRATLARALELYASHNARADGKLRASFEIAFLTGWAPAQNQPKPLRPGSAQKSLAEALGAQEGAQTDDAPPNAPRTER
ncbi:MAG: class I SAM-dependent methyltransferase [Neomegalonema sp.]|nr:class I SAM-dependent methyltransferase [Neomegalonema sp.]